MDTCPACFSPITASAKNCPTCGQPLGQGVHMALTAGSVLGGKYRIEKPLGQGGFGITYLAKHITLNQAVAIKEFFPEGAYRTGGSSQVGYRTAEKPSTHAVIQEAQAIARFNHPGIVKVFDVFEENNTAYVVMEFLEGITLEEHLAGRTLSPGEVIEIGIKVAEALSVVHQAGLLHRDLKPGNIFMAKDRIVLIDFGSAREFVQGKAVGHTRILSPGYAPLEQYASAAKVGPYTDIYALGATLYHALSGQAPPDALNRTQGIELPPLPPGVPAHLKQAILQALEVSTAKRPQNAAAFMALLKNTPAPRPAPTPQPTPQPAPQPSPQPAPAPQPVEEPQGGSGWLLGVMGIAVLAGLGWWILPKEQQPSSPALPQSTTQAVPPSNTQATPAVNTWQAIASLNGHSEDVKSVTFSPDGKTLASGSNGTIKLWDLETRKETATLRGYPAYVTSVAFSPDGKVLASGSWDTTIKLWDVANREEIATLEGHSGTVESVAFSPDGRILASGSFDDTIKLWDVDTSQEIATLGGHSNGVNSVAFSPDGKTLASGGYFTIKLWDVETREEIASLEGHSDYVLSIAYSPDGKTLASGSSDSTIKLWSIR